MNLWLIQPIKIYHERFIYGHLPWTKLQPFPNPFVFKHCVRKSQKRSHFLLAFSTLEFFFDWWRKLALEEMLRKLRHSTCQFACGFHIWIKKFMYPGARILPKKLKHVQFRRGYQHHFCWNLRESEKLNASLTFPVKITDICCYFSFRSGSTMRPPKFNSCGFFKANLKSPESYPN